MLNLEEGYRGIQQFNTYAGNLDEVTDERLLAQARVVLEEAEELLDAVNLKEGETQVLKEAVDVFVTCAGFLQMLYKAGYDVEGAISCINENNLTKFPRTQTDAFYTKVGYENAGIDVIVTQAASDVWVVKNSKGKVQKSIGYQKVDVSRFTPSATKEI